MQRETYSLAEKPVVSLIYKIKVIFASFKYEYILMQQFRKRLYEIYVWMNFLWYLFLHVFKNIEITVVGS